MTKATQPASWGSSQGWFLVSPSLFLSTSRLALHGQVLACLWLLLCL